MSASMYRTDRNTNVRVVVVGFPFAIIVVIVGVVSPRDFQVKRPRFSGETPMGISNLRWDYFRMLHAALG
jgi:hypothetical protein